MKKSIIGEKDRRIVPRWRGFTASIDVQPSSQSPKRFVVSESFLKNEADWHEDPSLWNAMDFIADAIVEGRTDLASQAIDQVRKDARLPAAGAAMIDAALGQPSDIDIDTGLTVEEESAKQIRQSRKRLAEHQWDAVEWMDLARSFTNLGMLTKAARCVGAAVKLAPTNRFVIRAASRFYVHNSDPERALWLLGRAGSNRDPWLMAPQIAISGIVGHSSIFARDGMRMLNQDFAAPDLSELRAALGTLDVANGKLVHAKKLLRQSLAGANENSVAQVEWLNRSQLGDVIDVSLANPPRLYEAGAWSAFATGVWEESRRLSELWFRDQPFSGNAATLYSYVLCDVLHDYDTAIKFLKTALRCNPKHPILLNNMAYASIKLGRLADAESYLAHIPNDGDPDNLATAGATHGLLDFRRGETEKGRAKFLEVISYFNTVGDRESAGRAATHLALEELNSNTQFTLEAVRRSIGLTEGSKVPHVLHKVKELETTVRELAALERGT